MTLPKRNSPQAAVGYVVRGAVRRPPPPIPRVGVVRSGGDAVSKPTPRTPPRKQQPGKRVVKQPPKVAAKRGVGSRIPLRDVKVELMNNVLPSNRRVTRSDSRAFLQAQQQQKQQQDQLLVFRNTCETAIDLCEPESPLPAEVVFFAQVVVPVEATLVGGVVAPPSPPPHCNAELSEELWKDSVDDATTLEESSSDDDDDETWDSLAAFLGAQDPRLTRQALLGWFGSDVCSLQALKFYFQPPRQSVSMSSLLRVVHARGLYKAFLSREASL
jgi:hypothetical protein